MPVVGKTEDREALPSRNFQLSGMQSHNRTQQHSVISAGKGAEYQVHRNTKGPRTQSGSRQDREFRAQERGIYKRPGVSMRREGKYWPGYFGGCTALTHTPYIPPGGITPER